MSKANRKRRNKGGRPRLDVEREPNGRPVRSLRRAETEAETRSVAIEARMRVYGAPESECQRPEYGSALGRLYLTGHINKLHKEAGDRVAEDFSKYYGLTGIQHPSAKAQDISRVRGLGGEVSYEAARAASNRVMLLEKMLAEINGDGRAIASVVKRICVMDDESHMSEVMLKHLATGLSRMVQYYGIGRQVAA